MDTTTEEIVNKLKAYEQQELTYYQATQNLLKAGYNQLQIDDAEDEFKYTEPTTENAENVNHIVAETESETSVENAEDKVGDILLKDTRKKPLPTWFTLWSPSTYGLNIEANTALMKSGSGRLSVVLIALVASFILTFLTPKVFSPQTINNTRYCNIDDPLNCVPANAISYGWPIHGENIKYEAQGRVIGNVTDAGVYETNFALFFIGVCTLVFLVDTARTRL